MLSSNVTFSLGQTEALVAFAIAGLIISFTALGLSERGRWREDRHWSGNAAAAAVLGCGLWIMHYVHAYGSGRLLDGGHNGLLSGAVLIIMTTLSFAGFQTISHMRRRAGQAIGGATIGFSLGLGQYFLEMGTSTPAGFGPTETSIVMTFMAAATLGALTGFCLTVSRRVKPAPASCIMMWLTLMFIASGVMLNVQPVFDWAAWPEAAAGQIPVEILLGSTVVLLASLLLLHSNHRRRAAMEEMTRMRTLADVAFEGIVVCREGRIVHANNSFASLVGRTNADLAGLCLDAMIAPGACREGLLGSGTVRVETEIFGADQTPQAVEIFARDVSLQGHEHRVLAVRDIRDRKLSEARIQFLAHHDPITGLPNRSQFMQRLEQEINRASRSDSQFAVICVDLDRFKEVNDNFGHAAGDQLLRLVAERMKRVFRTYDVVGRMGGDEFAIVECAGYQPEAAIIAVRRLINAFTEPFDLDGLKITIGASAGIAIFPADAQDAESLLTRADLALYRSKSDGRGTFCLFESSMDDQLRERRILANDLRNAVVNDDIAIYYEPIAQLEDGRITGFEALVRWRHPLRGWIDPKVFMPLAEEIGIMPDLGRRILRRACNEAASWPIPLFLSVNLSLTQVNGDLYELIGSILVETGLEASRLRLELTEHALHGRNRASLEMLHGLQALGVGVIIDHFGSGSSSLATLRACPISRFKVDRSFIADMIRDEDTCALVEAMAGIGRALGVGVSAAGCDTMEQSEKLKMNGFSEAQGQLFGAALPINAYAHVTGCYQAEHGHPAAQERIAASL